LGIVLVTKDLIIQCNARTANANESKKISHLMQPGVQQKEPTGKEFHCFVLGTNSGSWLKFCWFGEKCQKSHVDKSAICFEYLGRSIYGDVRALL
jgi:hypothetical protein